MHPSFIPQVPKQHIRTVAELIYDVTTCTYIMHVQNTSINSKLYEKMYIETVRGAVVQWLARPLVTPAVGVRFPD